MTISQAQLDALEAAVVEGFTKSAQAKRVEFGDQATTHASRLDLEAAQDFLNQQKKAADTKRKPWAVARFGCGGGGGRDWSRW